MFAQFGRATLLLLVRLHTVTILLLILSCVLTSVEGVSPFKGYSYYLKIRFVQFCRFLHRGLQLYR